MSYHVFKISCIFCLGYAAYCAFVNNIQMAIYMAAHLEMLIKETKQ